MTTLFIIVIIIMVFALIFGMSSSSININQIYGFKQVYEIETDLININIVILDKNNTIIANIADYNDIASIVEKLGNTKVKIINGSLSNNSDNKIKITNKNKECIIMITKNKLTINNDEKTVYEFKTELYNELNKIIDKYK